MSTPTAGQVDTLPHWPKSAATEAPLPSQHQVLLALWGSRIEGPLATTVSQLGVLHRQRQGNPGAAIRIDRRRKELVNEINQWLDTRLPRPHPAAKPVSDTVGALFDRMAAAAARVRLEMVRTGPKSVETHAMWTRLAGMAIQYTDLAADLAQGRVRLPITADVEPPHA